jgi:hypothetical protein
MRSMLPTELDTKASPRLINTELPDGSAVIIFPVALASGSDMLLTRREVAHILRLSEGFLRHLGTKIMPTVKLGGAVRYRLSDVLAYIESKTVTVESKTSGTPREHDCSEGGRSPEVSQA